MIAPAGFSVRRALGVGAAVDADRPLHFMKNPCKFMCLDEPARSGREDAA